MSKKLTVFTPTYNRAYIIGKLYESLKQQTNKDFCWIIVDDGSEDNTREIVDKWKKEGFLEMYYYHQENSGKMSAHNLGVEKAETELFMCIDSDDYLVPTAIENLIENWNQFKGDNIAGLIAKRGSSKDKQIGKGSFPEKKVCKMSHFMGEKFVGDTTLCFKTDVLRKFKFPIIEGEKFISESYIYDQIDREYEYIIDDEILTICEYLDDGYTRNMDFISYQNPVGRMYHEAQNMFFAVKTYEKFKAAIRYNIYKCISKHEDVRHFSGKEKVMLFFAKPIGYVLFRKKRKRVKEHEIKIR